MKQVRLFLGGHKFHVQDYNYMQDGNIDTMKSIVNGLTGEKIFTILSGVVLTGQGGFFYTWTEGVVKYQDNFYFMPANAVSTDISIKSFDLVEIPDPLNPVIYRDGQNRDVHVDTQMQLRAPGGLFGAIALIATQSLIKDMRDHLANNLDENMIDKINEFGWDNANLVFGADITEKKPVQYRKIGSRIEWRGQLNYTGAGSAPQLLTSYPVTLRPANPDAVTAVIGVTCSGQRSSGVTFTYATTAVTIQGWVNPTGTIVFHLDGLNYQI